MLLAPVISRAQVPARGKSPSTPMKAEDFPTAAAVEFTYSDPAQRLAALQVLLDLLEFRAGTKAPLAIERQNDYRRAITRLDPPRGANVDLEVAARKLKSDLSFQSAVAALLLPGYAPEAARKAAIANGAAAEERRDTLFRLSSVTVAIIVLLLPTVMVFAGSRVTRGSASSLPPELSRVHVLSKSYDLNFEMGRAVDYRSYYDPKRPRGGPRTIGGTTVTNMAGDTQSTEYGAKRVVIPNRTACLYETRAGVSGERLIGAHEFYTDKDAKVAYISCGSDALLCYDVANKPAVETSEIAWMHRIPGVWLWLGSNAVGIGGLVAIYFLVIPGISEVHPLQGATIVPLMLLNAITSTFYIWGLNAAVKGIRNRQFRQQWQPRLESFLNENTQARRESTNRS